MLNQSANEYPRGKGVGLPAVERIACQSVVGMSEAVDVVAALAVRATESESCIDVKTPPLGKKGSYAKKMNDLAEPYCERPKNMGWVQLQHRSTFRKINCERPKNMGWVQYAEDVQVAGIDCERPKNMGWVQYWMGIKKNIVKDPRIWGGFSIWVPIIWQSYVV